MKTPLTRWYGGKYSKLKYLLPLIPRHDIYVEVFAGSAALFFAKQPSRLNVINDVNKDLINFYRVLRDESKLEKLLITLDLIPYSRNEFFRIKEEYSTITDEIEKAASWYVLFKQAFSGDMTPYSGWSYAVKTNPRMKSYFRGIEELVNCHTLIKQAQIDSGSFTDIIKRYDSVNTFFYCDPPYVQTSRHVRGRERYQHELTDENHQELVELLLTVKGKVLLSGYENELYQPLETCGWFKQAWSCYSPSARQDRDTPEQEKYDYYRTEVVWYNFNI